MEQVRSSEDPQGLSSPVRASRSPSSSVRAMEEELVGVDCPEFLTNVLWRPLEQAWNEILDNNSGNEAARVEDPVGNQAVERVDEKADVTNSTEAPGRGPELADVKEKTCAVGDKMSEEEHYEKDKDGGGN